jgi:tyrosine-protein kinase Etk/Wzc
MDMPSRDRALPSAARPPQRAVPAPATLQAAAPLPHYEAEIELSGYLQILTEQRWRMAVIMALCLFCGGLYALLVAPVYEATMLIHVEEDLPNNNTKNMIGEISAMFDVKAAAISEMELIKSRMVIAKSVDNLGLYIDAKPVYLPLIGAAIARYNRSLSAPGLFGYGGYAWGAESIDITRFYVPEALQNTSFRVIVGAGRHYRLLHQQAGIDVQGQTGVPLTLSLPQGQLLLTIEQLVARPGIEFSLRYVSKLAAIEQVQKAMLVAEIGKQSGLISITMSGPEAKSTYDTLTAIGREYIHQNVTRKLEEAEKSLAFLEKQLPDIKQRLDDSESAFYRFRNQSGTVDLPEESKLSLQQLAAVKARQLELRQKRNEMLVVYTAEHPVIQALQQQLDQLDREISRANAHIRQLPILEQELLRLSREVKVNTELYSALLNSAQQLRLVKAGKVSNVRLIDLPMLPEQPARPHRGTIMAIAAATGLCLGLAVVVLQRLLVKGIQSAGAIEQLLGARVVYANIPHSPAQDRYGQHAAKVGGDLLPLLAALAPGDPAVESLRCLRTTLQVSMPHQRNNVVQICGPTAMLGKSFICANFAAVLASSGKRVLLIDADLRSGQLHRYFDQQRGAGLTEAIAASLSLRQAVRETGIGNLQLLTTGALPPNPAEFLLHPNVAALLALASLDWDYVLLDVPPLLAVSDALVLASHAGSVFIVARAGHTSDDELNESVKRLNHAGVAPQGVLFNDLRLRDSAQPRLPAPPLVALTD